MAGAGPAHRLQTRWVRLAHPRVEWDGLHGLGVRPLKHLAAQERGALGGGHCGPSSIGLVLQRLGLLRARTFSWGMQA